jgi:hexosaminidase
MWRDREMSGDVNAESGWRGPARSWSAVALHRFASPGVWWKSGRGLPQSKTLARGSLMLVAFTMLLFALTSLATATPAVIPQPMKMEERAGAFKLEKAAQILVDKASRDAGEYLATKLRPATGLPLRVKATKETQPIRGAILLTTNSANPSLGAEGYALDVTPDVVVVRAPTQAGLFYGVQTLLQLLPAEVFAMKPVKGADWSLPAVTIEDQPRFQWRGVLLDVSRHFFTKDEVKRVLDLMALHKLNTFHWHLVDDQGWRIEIKKYPKLTSIGAWRTNASLIRPQHGTPPVTAHPAWTAPEPTAFDKDGRYGGFYTQQDIREIVAYAKARHITVIPEIELPGHSVAVLAAYPELNCSGGPFSTDIGAGVHHGVYCAGSERPFEFLEDVLREVLPLFPAKYIHIGGDEVQKQTWQKCPKCQARIKTEGLKDEEELQSWFIRRMEKFVAAQGKTMIGWSEILQGGLAPNAVVMDWIGGGKEAANSGHDVVMTPMSHCYFDHYQSRDVALEPRAIGGFTPLEKVFAFEPIPAGLDAQHAKHILGAQANFWTEYIGSRQHLEYMMFPRLCALAEVVWSPKAARNWDDFSRRLKTHEQRLGQLGVHSRKDATVKLGEWTQAQIRTEVGAIDWDVTANVAAAGQYRVALEYTTGNHGVTIKSVALLKDGQPVARDEHEGFAGAEPRETIYVLNLPAFQPGAKYTLQAVVVGEGGSDSRGVVAWTFSKPNPL